MKGLSVPLTVVLTLIVVLIVALVVVTIFGGQVTTVSDFASAKQICTTQLELSCRTVGTLPLSWTAKTIRVGTAAPESCDVLAGLTGCPTTQPKPE